MKKRFLKGTLFAAVICCQVFAFSLGAYASEGEESDGTEQTEVVSEDEDNQDEKITPLCIGKDKTSY